MRLIKEILTLLLGYKYRVVILKDAGVERYWVCSYIFEDTPQGNARLKRYLERLREKNVVAHEYWETVSFRSRKPYGEILEETQKELRRYAEDAEEEQ